jgi:hypothetical protein
MEQAMQQMTERLRQFHEKMNANEEKMLSKKIVPYPGEVKSVAEQQEVPEEEKTVKTFASLKQRHLAIGGRESRRNGTVATVGPRRSWPQPAYG